MVKINRSISTSKALPEKIMLHWPNSTKWSILCTKRHRQSLIRHMIITDNNRHFATTLHAINKSINQLHWYLSSFLAKTPLKIWQISWRKNKASHASSQGILMCSIGFRFGYLTGHTSLRRSCSSKYWFCSSIIYRDGYYFLAKCTLHLFLCIRSNMIIQDDVIPISQICHGFHAVHRINPEKVETYE